MIRTVLETLMVDLHDVTKTVNANRLCRRQNTAHLIRFWSQIQEMYQKRRENYYLEHLANNETKPLVTSYVLSKDRVNQKLTFCDIKKVLKERSMEEC